MSTLSFPYNRVAAYGAHDYDRDNGFEIVEAKQLHFALPRAADDTVHGQFLELRRCTPCAIAIYKEVRGSYTKLFARRGQNVSGFAHFAALHTRHGWQVVATPKDGSMWSPRNGTGVGQPVLYDAPPQLPANVALRDGGATYVSLLAGFLYGGGLVYDAYVDAALLSAQPATLPFILRRDFLFLQRWSESGDEGEDTGNKAKLDKRRELFAGFVRTMQFPCHDGDLSTQHLGKESTDLQLGLLRSITPARIALYESSSTRQAFVRTHERPGEPTERLLDAAFARTPKGWLPLKQEVAFAGSFHGRVPRTSVSYDSVFGSDSSAVYFSGLFDAWLYAGGVRYDVPEPVPESNVYRHHYIGPQANKHVGRWRACASASSRQLLEAWGQSFAVPLPFVLSTSPASTRAWGVNANAHDPSAGLPKPITLVQDCLLTAWTELSYDPEGWHIDAAQKTEASPTLFAEVEQDVLVDVDKASPTSSPRPLARRLTWPGLQSLGNLTSTPTHDATNASP